MNDKYQNSQLIQLSNASMKFGRRTLWEELSLTVNSGEVVGIVGPSGCGKSTLLGGLGFLHEFTTATYRLNNQEACGISQAAIRKYYRNTLGFIFQQYALIPHESVEKNLRVAQKFVKEPSALKERHRCEALVRFGMEDFSQRKVGTLSGGEQQRVALARLWLKQPSVVLADEPSAALDESNADVAMAALRSLADAGSAVVLATHNDRLRAQCDTVVDLVRFIPESC